MQLFAATIDAADASALARFYADLLGMEVTYDGPEGALVAGGGKSLMFQQVSDYTPPQWPDPAHPQQGHLDVIVDDPDHLKAVGTRAEGWVPPGSPTGPPGSHWPTRRGTRSACRFPDPGSAPAGAVAGAGHRRVRAGRDDERRSVSLDATQLTWGSDAGWTGDRGVRFGKLVPARHWRTAGSMRRTRTGAMTRRWR
jgi:catechol 2,3-dioxygenase-like lactoylglutathione lyase family enzyme